MRSSASSYVSRKISQTINWKKQKDEQNCNKSKNQTSKGGI